MTLCCDFDMLPSAITRSRLRDFDVDLLKVEQHLKILENFNFKL